ncbi:hypothetical protein UlMin_008203 [Ulmus minor]
MLEETESPFSEDIRAAPMPPRLKLPDLKYDGTGDPAEHLETYKSWMELNSATNAFQCRAFENESTEAFLNRFVKEEMSVKDRNDSTACGALMAGLRSATVLKYMVSIKEDVSYPELISEVRRHIQAEKTSDLEASKLSQDIFLGGKRKIDSQAGSSKAEENGNSNGKKNNECRVLKDEIERLIQRGQLRNYVRNGDQQPRQPAQENQQPEQEGEDIEVRVIIGGPATGDTNRARKNYARQARSEPFPHQINLAEHKNKAPRFSNEPIIFTEEEASGLWHPHKDAIVVALRIASRKVYKILIDNGSSADILFRSTLNRMDLVGAKFNPIKSALYGFTGDSIHSEGVLNLPVELGTHPCQHIQSVEFVVVDCPSSYNAIIGRPTLNAIRAVTSTYHLLVKFPTVGGIGILKGDQQASRDIYEAANRSSNAHRMNIIKTCKGPLEHPPPRTITIDLGAGHPPPNNKSSSHEKFLQ